MQTSTSVAHWRQSRGALKQSWGTTGQFPAYRLTQEHEAYQSRASHAPFTYLAAVGYLLPAFVSVVLGPIPASTVLAMVGVLAPVAAAIVLVALVRPLGAQIAFIASAVVLAAISPEHDWVFSIATAAMWGTTVALQSRGDFMPDSR